MPHTFLFWYLLSGFVTWYVSCSIAVAVDLDKEPPIIANPFELKENVKIGQLLLCFLIGAVPFVNFALAGAGLVFIVINVIVWTFLRLNAICEHFDLDDVLDIQPFRKKNKYKDE
jgi:hypothetical protein